MLQGRSLQSFSALAAYRLSSRLAAVIALGISCTIFSGCGFTKFKKEAENLLNRHFQSIATNGYETAIVDYGSQFFQKYTKEEWSSTLSKLSAKLGTYQSHTITSWRVFKKTGTFGAGTTVEMVCQTTYSKYSAEERFVIFKGVLDSDYKILGHYIGSNGLLKD